MKASLILTSAAGIVCGGVAVSSVSAMPIRGLDPALAAPFETAKKIEAIRWICGPYGCHRVPGWRRHDWCENGNMEPWWGYRYGFYYPCRPDWGWGPWGYRYYW